MFDLLRRIIDSGVDCESDIRWSEIAEGTPW